MKKRLILGVSGASGAPLALRAMKIIADLPDVECHLVVSRGAEMTIPQECGICVEAFQSYADRVYQQDNIGASIASGSYETIGMLILPCSMKTLAGIRMGYSDSLLLRAADVVLKEQRTLVLGVRESPLSKVHLDNMAYLAGLSRVYLMPLVLSYYHSSNTLEDMEMQLVARMLWKFGLEVGVEPWDPKN